MNCALKLVEETILYYDARSKKHQKTYKTSYSRKERREEKRGRRCKQLMVDLKEKRRYCSLKDEALYRTLCRRRFTRGRGPVARTGYAVINDFVLLHEELNN